MRQPPPAQYGATLLPERRLQHLLQLAHLRPTELGDQLQLGLQYGHLPPPLLQPASEPLPAAAPRPHAPLLQGERLLRPWHQLDAWLLPLVRPLPAFQFLPDVQLQLVFRFQPDARLRLGRVPPLLPSCPPPLGPTDATLRLELELPHPPLFLRPQPVAPDDPPLPAQPHAPLPLSELLRPSGLVLPREPPLLCALARLRAPFPPQFLPVAALRLHEHVLFLRLWRQPLLEQSGAILPLWLPLPHLA